MNRQPGAPLRAGWRDAPHPSRLPAGRTDRGTILERHRDALALDRPTYVDPATGATVMTAATLAAQGACCDQGCRHCPWVGAEPAADRSASRPEG